MNRRAGSDVRAAFRISFDMGERNFDQLGHHDMQAEGLTAIMLGMQLSHASSTDLRTVLSQAAVYLF